ncbi:MAG: aspartate carbamoyltransferase [Nanoarchaeota archaeon]|nr:aspartate carbamoyltransferase [Nanoarchaeota archaeon]
MKHLIKAQQFTPEILQQLFSLADSYQEQPRKALQDKVVATLFYQPSSRTRLSFESAVHRLGGNVISTVNAREFSSVSKGETLEDTLQVISAYADAIVVRHDEEDVLEEATRYVSVPVINAGDGADQHPTQALLDAYTIQKEFGRLNNLHVAFVGDLYYGRTVRSLSYLLTKYPNNRFSLVSPEDLSMKEDILSYFEKKGVSFETRTFEEVLDADIIYMTRAQFINESESGWARVPLGYDFSLTPDILDRIPSSTRVLHPLPHNEEINLPKDIETTDPRIAYFRQVKNGLFARMAVLDYLINK